MFHEFWCRSPKQGRQEGGTGENDPGAHEGARRLQEGRWLQRAQQRAHELERGPIDMTMRKSASEA